MGSSTSSLRLLLRHLLLLLLRLLLCLLPPLLLLPLLLLPLLLLLLLLQLLVLHLLRHHHREILVLLVSCLGVLRTTWAIWSLASFAIQYTSPSTKLGDAQPLQLPIRLRTTFACLRMFLCQFCVHIWSTCGSWVDIFL